MTALPTTVPSDPHALNGTRSAALGLVRAILILEAVAGLVLAIFLSMLAEGQGELSAETNIRFAAAAAFLFAIAAAIAARGIRRRRGWAWTTAAVLQLLLAVGTGIAIVAAEWHPAYLAGFGLSGLAMLVLCLPSVRRALGQD